MNMGNLLPQRWRMMREAGRHNEAVLGILETPPIRPARDGLVLFAAIGSAEVLPFLVAVKALWAQLGRGRVAVLDNGTLTSADRAILAQHCGDPQILRRDDVPRGPFPHGQGWEALLTVLDHRAGEYWLQLDCSTLAVGPVWELERAIGSNRSFAMMGSASDPTEPLELGAFARRCGADDADDPQGRIESLLSKVAPGLGWKYLRGSGGLAGFAAGNGGRDRAGAFVSRLLDAIGPDDVSGSAQATALITANFLIANEGAPACLPPDRYLNYTGADWHADTAVVHFGNAHRYDRGAYMEASRGVIARFSA